MGLKKALIMGLNYIGTDNALNGCINDANRLKSLLQQDFGYNDTNITLMTDNEIGDLYPTQKNIITQIENIIENVKNNNIEELWISYSGHGSYIFDVNNDEQDNKDETICPLDMTTNGHISDDMINKYLSEIPSTCRVICLFDSCHSGTMGDLKYKYIYDKSVDQIKTSRKRIRVRIKKKKKKWKWKWVTKQIRIPGKWNWKSAEKNITPLNSQIITISGCRDPQVSMDIYSYQFNKWGGALTNAFIQIINDCKKELSCQTLCLELNKYMLEKKYSQKPVICSSYKLENDNIFYRKLDTCCIR